MHDQHVSRSKMVAALGPAALGIATGAFALAIYSGFYATMPGVALRGFALAVLGGALAIYTNMRLGPFAQGRLGGRAQQVHKRYRTLVLATVGLVYLVLLAGSLVTDTGALWSCQTLPLCTPVNTSRCPGFRTPHPGSDGNTVAGVSTGSYLEGAPGTDVALHCCRRPGADAAR